MIVIYFMYCVVQVHR